MGKAPTKLYRRKTPANSSKARNVFQRLNPVREFVCHFEWIHPGLGILGNVAFFVGSIFFLWESTKTAGVWLFIMGSLGMLIASVGSTIVKAEQE